MKTKCFSAIFMLALIILVISMNSNAGEIKKTIDYGWGLGKKDPYWKRQFTGQITADTLPVLNKTTKILVRIKSKYGTQSAPGFVIRGCEWGVDYTQLEPEWPPPISPEDVYEGSFTIKPLEVGTFGLRIRARGDPFRGSSHNEFGFYFTIDESGKTIHFSNIQDHEYMANNPPPHPPIQDDQVKIRYPGGRDFSNSFKIAPPPKVNDTSTVYFQLISNRYCPQGVQLSLILSPNLEIFSLPSSWVGEVREGDANKDSFRIVPTTTDLAFLALVVEGNSISKEVLDRGRVTARRRFNLHFSFDDASGKLEYVGREGKYYNPEKWWMSAKEIAKSMGEEYRPPKGTQKTFLSKPRIPIVKKR
jgi:hypothetical protein